MSLLYPLACNHRDTSKPAHGHKEQVKWGAVPYSNWSKGHASLLLKTLEIQELIILLLSILSVVFHTNSICPFASPFLFSVNFL